MFGAGISLASTRFLLYFLKLTGHCQRVRHKNTYMLSRECGYALGLVLALMIPVALETALVLILLSVALYLLLPTPGSCVTATAVSNSEKFNKTSFITYLTQDIIGKKQIFCGLLFVQ